MTDRPQDPSALFREMLGQWERTTNTLANQLMGTSEFSRSMNNMTSLALKLQQGMNEATARLLAAANLPSRQDIIALGDRLQVIEQQLERIEAALRDVGAANPSPTAKPARTRRPPHKGTVQ